MTQPVMIALKARDGHELEAYLARPAGAVKGGLVVAQEMYGINGYLRRVCDFYAAHGYLAIAPALHDRIERGLVLSYDKADHDRAQKIYMNWDWDLVLDDLEAGRQAVAEAGKVSLVGFCAGGTLAWLAACRRSYACTIAYYGSLMPDFAGENPRCPVLAHIGEKDKTMPPARIDAFRATQPAVPICLYPDAQHGFDNEQRVARFHPEACRLARERSLEFLARHVD